MKINPVRHTLAEDVSRHFFDKLWFNQAVECCYNTQNQKVEIIVDVEECTCSKSTRRITTIKRDKHDIYVAV